MYEERASVGRGCSSIDIRNDSVLTFSEFSFGPKPLYSQRSIFVDFDAGTMPRTNKENQIVVDMLSKTAYLFQQSLRVVIQKHVVFAWFDLNENRVPSKILLMLTNTLQGFWFA